MHRLWFLLLILTQAAFAAAPIQWQPPASFNPNLPDLGLAQLPGVSNQVLYMPQPVPEGATAYPSTMHGLYNHHPMLLCGDDWMIVYWTNHAVDENAPGQRVLALLGRYDAQRQQYIWDRTPTEIAPPISALHRRYEQAMPPDVDPRIPQGGLNIVGDQLLSRGVVGLCWGWTDEPGLKLRRRSPLDPPHYSDERTRSFSFDVSWVLPSSYAQLWAITDGKLTPQSPLCLSAPIPDQMPLTTKQSLHFGPALPPYQDAPNFKSQPPLLAAIQQMDSTRVNDNSYQSGQASVAANGKNGLMHRAQFQRPDGSWVIIRDNLLDPGYYYAAERLTQQQSYPPGEKTNLYGGVLPAAGSLPDGRCWILANTNNRQTFYLTISDDGRDFDRTALVLHIDESWTPGLGKSAHGGPQYPQAVFAHDSVWIIYSIGKQAIGLTRIPLRSFDLLDD